ncbi:MAG: hypothetical protein AAGG01_17790, partial [Planctomycetota bacterium]
MRSVALVFLALGCVSQSPSAPPRLAMERPLGRSESESEAITWAVQAGDTDAVEAHLEAGATVHASASGWELISGLHTPPPGRFEADFGDLLDRAIDLGDERLFDLLAANGVDPLQRGGWRKWNRVKSILHERLLRAAWRGHGAIVDRLLAVSAAQKEPLGPDSPALAAAAAGHIDLYDDLCAVHGAKSAHAAAALGRTEELARLLRKQPRQLLVKEPRCSAMPLAWAVFHGREGTVAWLLDQGADANERIDSEVVSAIWEGAPTTEMPFYKELNASLLSAAVRKDLWGIAERLVASGAYVDATALRALMLHRSPKALALLREAKRRGQVITEPRDWAIEGIQVILRAGISEPRALARLQVLLDLGAAEGGISLQIQGHVNQPNEILAQPKTVAVGIRLLIPGADVVDGGVERSLLPEECVEEDSNQSQRSAVKRARDQSQPLRPRRLSLHQVQGA